MTVFQRKILLLMLIPLLSLPLLPGSDVWPVTSSDMTPNLKLFDKPISRARWLWFQAPQVAGFANAYYRMEVELDEEVESCWIMCALDDTGEVFLNGKALAETRFEQPDMQIRFHRFEPVCEWKKGRNVLAMIAHNNGALGGMIMRGEIKLVSGKVIPLVSDRKSWKASGNASDGWMTPSFDAATWAPAMELGDVLMEPWKSVSNVVNYMLDDEEKRFYQARIDQLVNIDFLKDAPEWKGKVVWYNGLAGIELNGKPEPPVTLVIGFNPWIANTADDIVKAGKSNIKFIEYISSSNRCFVAPGKYDFSMLDNDIKRILVLNPNAAIIVAFRLDLQGEWLRNNPDELIGYANGPSDGRGGQLGRFRAPSMASEKFRAEMENFLTAAVKYMQQQDYYKRVIGMRVGYGVFGEWHYYGMKLEMPDTGKAMTREFRKYLADKYGSDSALQKAWHDASVTLDSAAVPDKTERIGQGSFFRDPAGKDRKLLDYYDCHGQVNSDTLLRFAAAVKKADPRLLVGAYYGYFFCMGYPAEGQTLMLEKVLSSPNIDFLSSPYSYNVASRIAGGDGMLRSLPGIFKRHKKLLISEVDVHTHKTRGRDVYRVGTTPEDSQAVFRRDIAISYLNGAGAQFLEFDARRGFDSWFNHPMIYKSWYDGLRIWHYLVNAPEKKSFCEIAVVVSADEMYKHGYPNGLEQRPVIESIVDKPMHALYRAGAPFDVLSLKDFLNSSHNYKVVILLNIFTPAADERKQLIRKVRRPGVLAVWSYASGWVTEDGFSESAMSDLIGIKAKAEAGKHPWSVSLGNGVTMSSVSNKKVVSENPRICSVDRSAEVWAYYTSHGRQAAIVSKNLKQGSMTMLAGMPIMDEHVWAAILHRGNVHCYTAPGEAVVAGNGRWLMVHTGRGGAIELKLPKRCKQVRELYRSQTLGVDTSEVILKSSGAETWLLEIEY
ncbi:MAG: hypothetical protein E7047_07370 [Lentisphaerae bacterium]|nr:hypothetical protein [Lentisphaerota bacterium]